MNRVYALICLLSISLLAGNSPLLRADGDFERKQQFPPLDELFQDHTIEELSHMNTSEHSGINRFYTSEGGAVHLPATGLAADLLDAALGVDYSVGVESLYLIPWREVSPELSGLPAEEFDRRIYNILRKVSSLEGIEYYSASREKMRTLFAECWAIDNPDDRRRIEDPLVSEIPESDTIFIYQKDLTFGKNISRVDYQYKTGQFRMGILNLTTMTYMLFPVVGRENMSMQILILPCREGIVFYGLNTVKVLDLPIFYKKMESSFTNRMIALSDWFADHL